MDGLAVAASILYQLGTNGAFLLLSALGLIVILGMMNIINLAHGELMMMGAYTASLTYHRGVPFPLAVVLAFVVVGLFGAVLERLVVRRFYGRELGALVVTWGPPAEAAGCWPCRGEQRPASRLRAASRPRAGRP